MVDKLDHTGGRARLGDSMILFVPAEMSPEMAQERAVVCGERGVTLDCGTNKGAVIALLTIC